MNRLLSLLSDYVFFSCQQKTSCMTVIQYMDPGHHISWYMGNTERCVSCCGLVYQNNRWTVQPSKAITNSSCCCGDDSRTISRGCLFSSGLLQMCCQKAVKLLLKAWRHSCENRRDKGISDDGMSLLHWQFKFCSIRPWQVLWPRKCLLALMFS